MNRSSVCLLAALLFAPVVGLSAQAIAAARSGADPSPTLKRQLRSLVVVIGPGKPGAGRGGAEPCIAVTEAGAA
jgi:hypothetical protein